MDENLVLTLEIYNKIQTAAPFRASKLLKKDERPRLVPVSISILEKKNFLIRKYVVKKLKKKIFLEYPRSIQSGNNYYKVYEGPAPIVFEGSVPHLHGQGSGNIAPSILCRKFFAIFLIF